MFLWDRKPRFIDAFQRPDNKAPPHDDKKYQVHWAQQVQIVYILSSLSFVYVAIQGPGRNLKKLWVSIICAGGCKRSSRHHAISLPRSCFEFAPGGQKSCSATWTSIRCGFWISPNPWGINVLLIPSIWIVSDSPANGRHWRRTVVVDGQKLCPAWRREDDTERLVEERLVSKNNCTDVVTNSRQVLPHLSLQKSKLKVATCVHSNSATLADFCVSFCL